MEERVEASSGILQEAPAQPEQKTATAAALMIRALERQGVEYIFGYPGGAVMPVYDALTDSPIRHILARHEQGAGFAAEGYARVTGKVGVCLVTSGPGLTNLLTGIADAYADSVPMVAIVGQVPEALMGTDAFQEVDSFGITMPVVKHSMIARDPAKLPALVTEAMHIAASGRPGPVLIELPKDVGAATVSESDDWPAPPAAPVADPRAKLDLAEAMIRNASKPLFYVGGGAAISRASEAVRNIVERTGIPVVATLKGLGVLPTDHPNFIGMLGMHGRKAANYAVQACDLLIAVGARFDDRVTGKVDTFAPGARVIHMDADAAEISKIRTADLGLSGLLPANLEAINPGPLDIEPWIWRVDSLKEKHHRSYDAPGDGIYAPRLLRDLSVAAGDSMIMTTDVGQHQMWVAQHCRFIRPEAHLTSGGLGAMGFGIPAGIGAILAEPDACVITVTGDGSIMMNIQELATINRYGLNLKILLLDNSCLGMVRQWQTIFYDGNHSEVDLSDNPDFAAIARAFGLEAFTIERATEVPGAIERLLNTPGAVLMHVKIDPRENVWPMVPPGVAISNMMEEEPCPTT
ncbi:MAG: acetolactate synthase 2 catalytic subunit [Proteobacteria bacterium]|nr:acetolactate synthase 2 catalytic subunit [Pseudomonadota bacterium]